MRAATAAALAVTSFVAGVPLTAALLFFPVMILAGPHSSILPSAIQPAVLVLGWIAVVVLPALGARRLFRRLRPRPGPGGRSGQ